MTVPGEPGSQSRLKLPTYPPVIFGAPCAVGLVVHFFVDVDLLPTPVSLTVEISLIVLSFALFGWSKRTMAHHGEHPDIRKATVTLVSTGPFGYTRNPIYLALAIAGAGIGISMDSIPVIASIPFGIIALQRLVIGREEAYLADLFDGTWAQYKSMVRRWI